MLTEDGLRSRSHGLRPAVLERQAEALGLPLLTACASWADYEARFAQLLADASRWDISHVIFGDVFPSAHKQWAENISRNAGLVAVEPLWDESTYALAAEFIDAGGRAIIVAASEDRLDRCWLGRQLTREALDRFRESGIDPGGENGEFHTLVTAFPQSDSTIPLVTIDSLSHGGCYLLDVDLERDG